MYYSNPISETKVWDIQISKYKGCLFCRQLLILTYVKARDKRYFY